LIHIYGLDIDKDSFKNFDGTYLLAYNCALLFIPMFVLWGFKVYRKFKPRNTHILPLLAEPPKVSLFNQRVLQAAPIALQSNPTENGLDSNHQGLSPQINRGQLNRSKWVESQDTRRITRSCSLDELQTRKFTKLSIMCIKRPKSSSLYKKQDSLKSLKMNLADKPLQKNQLNLKAKKTKNKHTPPNKLRLSVRELELYQGAESTSNRNTLQTIIPMTAFENIVGKKDKKSSIQLNMSLIMVTLLTVICVVAEYTSLFAFVTQILVDITCFVVPVSYLFNNQYIIQYTERKLIIAYKKVFNKF
jgi:hypothetical protein